MFLFFDFIKRNFIVFSFVFIGAILTIVLMSSGALNKELTISKTSFAPGETETIDNSIPVVFYFSEEIDPKTVDVKISPEIKFLVKTGVEGGLGTLSINPLPWWKFNKTYLITINKNLRGKQGGRLKNNISFSFSFIFPDNNPTIFQQPGPGPNN